MEFYCDTGNPYQKGAIEVNYELIRRILPKGRRFEQLAQEDINLMMNLINSYKRKKLSNLHSHFVWAKLFISILDTSYVILWLANPQLFYHRRFFT